MESLNLQCNYVNLSILTITSVNLNESALVQALQLVERVSTVDLSSIKNSIKKIKSNCQQLEKQKKECLAIENVAKEKDSKLFYVKKPTKKFKLSLEGTYQQMNAAIALETIAVLNLHYNLNISKEDTQLGLKTTKWPGRFEYIKGNLLVDCAHNVNGVKVLVKELKKIKKKKILVTGILKDKEKEAMLKLLEPYFYKIVLTKAKVPRATDPKELAKYLKKPCKIINDPKKAVKYAQSIAKKNDLIVVAGSIYIVGEIYT